MESREIRCECGHSFEAEIRAGGRVAICPVCGLRTHLEQLDGVQDFLLVPGAVMGNPTLEHPVEGNLVVTLDSIAFLGHPAGNPAYLKDEGEDYLTPEKKHRWFWSSVIGLPSTVLFFAFFLVASNWDPKAVVFAVVFVSSALLNFMLALRYRNKRVRLRQTGLTLSRDSEALGRFAQMPRVKRSLYEQITGRRGGLEKKMKMLARYRPGSVRMARKAIRSVEYAGGAQITVHGRRRSLILEVPQEYREKLAAILAGYRYLPK